MNARFMLFGIALIGLACDTHRDVIKTKSIIYTYYVTFKPGTTSELGHDFIASQVFDPPSSAAPKEVYFVGSDLQIDVAKNQLYATQGIYVSTFLNGIYNAAKGLYNLQSLSQSAVRIAVDVGMSRIYWMDSASRKLFQGYTFYPLAPKVLYGYQRVISNSASCTALIFDSKNNFLYFTDTTENVIYKADLNNLDNSKPVVVVSAKNSAINRPLDLAISADGEQLFWIDKTKNGIQVTNTATLATQQLYNVGVVDNLFYDSKYDELYWSSGKQVFKGAVDSNVWSQIYEAPTLIKDFVIND